MLLLECIFRKERKPPNKSVEGQYTLLTGNGKCVLWQLLSIKSASNDFNVCCRKCEQGDYLPT